MSVTREHTIWCDGKDRNGFSCPRFHQTSERVRWLRRDLQRRFGWVRVNGKDYCADHRPLPKTLRRSASR